MPDTTYPGHFVTFQAAPDHVTVTTGPALPSGAMAILTGAGFVATEEADVFRLSGPDAVQRAAQAAYYLSAADIGIEDPDTRTAELSIGAPDVAFARHPHEGLVAAVAGEDSTVGLPAQTLQRLGWRYDGRPLRDVYLAPDGTTDAEALSSAARATRALQAMGYSVFAQGLTAAPDTMASLSEAADDLATERGNVADLADTRDIADVLGVALDAKVGALPQLDRLLATVTDWCAELPPEDRLPLTALLGDLSHDIGQLSTGLSQAQRHLAELRTALPVAAPAQASPRASAARSSSVSRLANGPVLQSTAPVRTDHSASAPRR
ncbi:hypothetical protein ABH940_005583 [Streptacidiphilus sp. BW17]|uniref:hypothetical protein n=1 Tax=Streptacidiphilus sp. BW17 TaxID=3156274 RepID=UPI0035146460